MKRLVFSMLFVLTIMLIMPAQAQKCKLDFDKKDPITGERVRRSYININMWAKMALYRANDDLRFELSFARGGEDNFAIPAGSKVYIKLGDESILELVSANEALPVSFVNGNQVATSFAISYYITKEQMQQIGKFGIVFIKAAVINDITANYEVKKKKNKKITQSALCISQD
ncbi:MAG: hypothetical protein M0P66_15050 [Salinivirgaceae bacterium]|nr:hypothetical protein [Salinivirgaceae bacterium]